MIKIQVTLMEEHFRVFRSHLDQDQDLEENPFRHLKKKYLERKLGFYEFLDQMKSYNSVLYQLANYLKDTGISHIEIFDDNVLFTTRNDHLKIIFNGMERRGIPFEFLTWGFYEKPEYDLLHNLLTDGMTLLDVGANIGWYSLLWGKKFPNASIHAFEPIPDIRDYLKTNLILNGIQNVFVHNFGLSCEEKELLFHYNPVMTGLTSSQNILDYKRTIPVESQVKTLDAFASASQLSKIDLIKCDVEGAEYQIIQGGVRSISKDLPLIILELFHEWTRPFGYYPQEPIEALKQLGYRTFLPLDGKLEEVIQYIPNDFDRQNYFFLHSEHHKNLIETWLFRPL